MLRSTKRFDDFELDLGTGELRRAGRPVSIRSQAARVLSHLVANAGHLVPRQDLVEVLWPDSIVEYDQGVNNVIRHVRRVLGDDPQNPSYIETVPRQGYRFIAPIVQSPEDSSAAEREVPLVRPEIGSRPPSLRARLPAALAVTAMVVATVALWLTVRPRAEEPPTVAVLPLEGADPDTRILGASLADELARELTVTPARPLRVVGRASAEKASESAGDPLSTGALLGATHVVSGAVRGGGGRIEIELSLRRVADGEELWHERRMEAWPDLLLSQRKTARTVAVRITGELGLSTLGEDEPSVPLDQDALESYLKGRYLASKGTPEAAVEALGLLRRAVDTAPRFASARVALAGALLDAGPFAVAEARSLADEALRLAPGDPRAHLLRARIALTHEWDWEQAERHLKRAWELAPGDALVHAARAFYFVSLGKRTEALQAANIAQRLDPLSATMQGDVAMLYYLSGDNEGLLRESEELLRLEPHNRLAMALRLDALSKLKRWEESRAQAEKVCGSDSELKQAQGSEIVRRYQEIQRNRLLLAEPGPGRAIKLASLAASLGHQQEALDQLREAIRLRSPYLPFVPMDPDFGSLLSRPEFQKELRLAGHPLFAAASAIAAGAVSR